MDKKYIELVKIINEHINGFNKFLNNDNKVLLFDPENADNFAIYTELKRYPWKDFRFPNSDMRGVYFIVGYPEDEPTTTSMYIGKASLQPIGKRLYDHLNKDKNNSQYIISDGKGRKYVAEYVFSIDLESPGLVIFASAVEEYLITEAGRSIRLINTIGNKNN